MKNIFKAFAVMVAVGFATPAMANSLSNVATQAVQLGSDSVLYAHSPERIDYETKVLGLKALNDVLGNPLHQNTILSLKKELRLNYERQQQLAMKERQHEELMARQRSADAAYAERAAAAAQAKQNPPSTGKTISGSSWKRIPGTAFERYGAGTE